MLPKADIDQWLKILKKKLPKERIVKFSNLKKSDYKKIDVAIVANPNPNEVKKLVNLKWIQSVWVGVEKLVELSGIGDKTAEKIITEHEGLAVKTLQSAMVISVFRADHNLLPVQP